MASTSRRFALIFVKSKSFLVPCNTSTEFKAALYCPRC